MKEMVYGYVNGKAVYSRDEYIVAVRKFDSFANDEELVKYAENKTSGWRRNCGCGKLEGYYLSTRCYAEPFASLKKSEFARLVEIQKELQEAAKRADEAREWKLIGTYCYADNSEEQVWEDKDGVQKVVMTVAPHGDLC